MTVLVSDSFNRADNASILGTTDSYNGGTPKTWSPYGSNVWGISNNQAYYVSGGGFQYVFLDPSVSDYSISCNIIKGTNGNNNGLIFRYSNLSNHYKVYLSTPTSIVIAKVVSGTTTTLATVTHTFVDGEKWTISVNGSSIQLFINDLLLSTITDTFNQTATLMGFTCLGGGTTARWDNLQIEDVVSSEQTNLSSTVKSNSISSAIIKDTLNLSTSSKSSSSASANITKAAQGGLSSTVKSISGSFAVLAAQKPITASSKSNSAATGSIKSAVYLVNTAKSRTSASGKLIFLGAAVIIGTVRLKGSVVKNVHLKGSRILNVYLKGVVK